jgi:hypothetical protein
MNNVKRDGSVSIVAIYRLEDRNPSRGRHKDFFSSPPCLAQLCSKLPGLEADH